MGTDAGFCGMENVGPIGGYIIRFSCGLRIWWWTCHFPRHWLWYIQIVGCRCRCQHSTSRTRTIALRLLRLSNSNCNFFSATKGGFVPMGKVECYSSIDIDVFHLFALKSGSTRWHGSLRRFHGCHLNWVTLSPVHLWFGERIVSCNE